MLKRALLLSLFAHLAIAGGVLFFHTKPAKVQEELIVEAPLGNVFVQEATQGDATAAGPGKPLPPAESTGQESPASEDEGAQSSAAPGLPDGEASPLGKIQPSYPPLSRRLNEEGEAVFLVTIEANGEVSAVKLEKSSGFGRLDEAARSALQAAKFHPAAKGGEAVASTKRMRIEFRLETGKK